MIPKLRSAAHTQDRNPGPRTRTSDRAGSTAMMIDYRNGTRTTQRAHPKLTGCAQQDCLEVAKPESDYCPLHAEEAPTEARPLPGSGQARPTTTSGHVTRALPSCRT
jgi:hypothetical protein